jgi:Domain of unknown function (DUF1083).
MRSLLNIVMIMFLAPILGQEQDVETNNFPPPEQAPIINAIRINTPIQIDGKLTENAWKNADAITNFFRVEPVQGGVIKNPTTVRVLYDDKNIYFGVFASDTLGKNGVRIQNLRRDFNPRENDVFGIQIDAQNTKQYAISFQTTPYSTQFISKVTFLKQF